MGVATAVLLTVNRERGLVDHAAGGRTGHVAGIAVIGSLGSRGHPEQPTLARRRDQWPPSSEVSLRYRWSLKARQEATASRGGRDANVLSTTAPNASDTPRKGPPRIAPIGLKGARRLTAACPTLPSRAYATIDDLEPLGARGGDSCLANRRDGSAPRGRLAAAVHW
jgi:hypothetical protein